MKRPQSAKEKETVQDGRPKLQRPVLKRLGTLRELTRMFNGPGSDAVMGGMSFP